MKNVITLILLVWSKTLFSQVDSTIKTQNLAEIIFSANKIKESKWTVAQLVSVQTKSQIQSINASTTGDMLANLGAVSLQKSQQGGGSPAIRGFEASRVVMMIDGVRMNNLIYRAGHLQNIVTIDQSILERAEVLYGPASTVYGSDALGGVIHFYTIDPKINTVSAGGYVRLRAPNQEKTANGIINIGNNKWASLTSFTVSDFNDLKMGEKTNPVLGSQFGIRKQYIDLSNSASGNGIGILTDNSDPFIQKESGYQQLDILQKILYKPNETDSHILNIQYSNSTDVPRYDRLTDPLNANKTGLKSAEWYYGPQKRLMTAYDFRKTRENDGIHFGVNYQAIEESRNDRPFNGKFVRSRFENVKVFGLGIDKYKNSAKYEARYGLDFQYNDLASTAIQTSIENGSTKALNTRYPDGKNNMLNAAIYTTSSLIISKKLRITEGVRLGYIALNSKFNDKTFFPFPYDSAIQKNFIFSGNVGVIFTPESTWKLSGLLSTGFRAPNVDDLSKVFDSAKGTLIVPNPDLKPEKTINFEAGITKTFANKIYWENVIYTTNFRDAIVTDVFTLNGQNTIIYDGVSSKILANQNKRKANIWGFSSTFSAQICSQLTGAISYNYTKGSIKGTGKTADSPLDHIPPSFGRIALKYSVSSINLEAFMLWNSWKHIEDYLLNGEDNEVYATPKGTPSWKTLNVRASYNLHTKWSVLFGVDNIFDLQYRTFASGINAPGRNLFLTLRKNL